MNYTEEELLEGISASDNHDGDLTDEVIIQSVSQLVTANTATVTYLVFDASNNMGTLKRTLEYTDYARPHFGLKEALFYRPDDKIIITDRVTCSDQTKDYSGQIRIVSHNVNSKREGEYEVSLQVMNDMGDYVDVTLPVIVSEQYGRTQLIQLKQYLVYLKVGETEEFLPEKYISKVRNDNGATVSANEVSIKGSVDVEKPGTYYIDYTYSENTVTLTVIVEEVAK